MFTRAKSPPRVAPVRPVKSTGQTGVAWASRDEQHPQVNSPKSKLRSPESLHRLEQDFGDNRNTSRGVQPSLIPPKLVQKEGIEEIPPRTPLTLELGKPQNRAPLPTDLGGESQPKEPRRVPTIFTHQIPKSKVPKTTQRNHQERALKITNNNNREQHIQTLRNQAESSLHATKVHTRSSLPPDHPTLSTRSHHEALKLVLWKS
jgi:hypothetical protein